MSVSKPAQRQILTVLTIIALVFGAYFLREFFGVIFFAMIMSYMFTPVFRRLQTYKYTKRSGTAASLTFFISMLLILTPLTLIIFFTVLQVQNILQDLTAGQAISFDQLTADATTWVNNLLQRLPGGESITQAEVNNAINDVATRFAEGFLNLLRTSMGGIAGLTVSAVLYIYIFVNLLIHQDALIGIVKRLNPLGDKASNDYLQKMGDTTTAMVRGQFVIAFCQGLAEALILLVAGVENLFFFMFLIFTVLSIIPLGAGIVVIPVGIGLILTGNIWQGVWVLFGHFAIVTNIDNVLRPRLVPKRVRLNSALTMLAVFAGIGMFGFLGIVIGPVIMILIVTTVKMYLEAQGHMPTTKQSTADA